MLNRTYVDGKLVPEMSNDQVRDLVDAGHRVVAVDGGGVAVEITKDLLSKCTSSPNSPT